MLWEVKKELDFFIEIAPSIDTFNLLEPKYERNKH